MSAQLRQFFFGPLLDKLKNGDIPTEDTFRDWIDSHPFFRELSDTAQRTKGGLVKTTPDTKVNNRDGSDVLGLSPLGFKTFVQPQQLWRLIAGTNVTLVDTPRSATGADDSGEYIIDKTINVVIPPPPTVPTTTAQLVTSAAITLDSLTGAWPYTITGGTIAMGATLQAALVAMCAEINKLVAAANDIADKQYAEMLEAVGEFELTSTPPGTWDATKYVEPLGQLLAIASYPELHAKIGNTYGGVPPQFALPNLASDSYLRAVVSPSASVGTITGLADYSLTAANIPQHNHTFSGTTDPDGSHKHDIQTATSAPGTSINDGSGGAYTGVDTNAISTEPDHTHSFGPFNTGNYGSAVPTPIPLTPRAFNMYLKYRIKP